MFHTAWIIRIFKVLSTKEIWLDFVPIYKFASFFSCRNLIKNRLGIWTSCSFYIELKYDPDSLPQPYVVSCDSLANISGYWLISARRAVKVFEQLLSGAVILKFLCNGVYYHLPYDEIACLSARELFNVIYRSNEPKRAREEQEYWLSWKHQIKTSELSPAFCCDCLISLDEIGFVLL